MREIKKIYKIGSDFARVVYKENGFTKHTTRKIYYKIPRKKKGRNWTDLDEYVKFDNKEIKIGELR